MARIKYQEAAGLEVKRGRPPCKVRADGPGPLTLARVGAAR